MKNFENIAKKVIYGKVPEYGVIKGIGFKPIEEYYIDEHTYLFGIRLKSVRYWNMEDFVKKRRPKKDRMVIKGYVKEKEVK
jgi:hypothetical protein